jgi:hypothetical protein
MEELRDDQLAQVGGGDAWNTLCQPVNAFGRRLKERLAYS